MNETDTAQETPKSMGTHRAQAYAPWMIGVLVVFAVCECFFVIWGGNAFVYAMVGLIVAFAFFTLRHNQTTSEGCIGSVLVLLVAVFAVAATVLWPAISEPRELCRRSACANQLKQLGLGVINYSANNEGRFPPAWTVDESGRPMHSWRTLILPYMDEQELYETYDLQKPWNSSENQKVVEQSDLHLFRCPTCPDEPKNRTDYVAVVGNDTLWPPDGGPRTYQDFKKSSRDVPVLIEIRDSDIRWHEPRDVNLDDILSGKLPWSEGVHLVNGGSYGWNAFYESDCCRNVLFADGTARRLPVDLTPEELRKLFSITKPFDVEKLPYSALRPIVFRHVVFYLWLATLILQFHYIFVLVKRELEPETDV